MTAPQPYAQAAEVYLVAGWSGVLPLPPGSKWPPPKGYTGRDGRFPDRAQVDEWVRTRADWNIGVRLPDGVVGIDVDHYDKVKDDGTVVAKRGADTLAELAEEIGVELPATFVSTARPTPSGVRFYRVPDGVRFVGEYGDDVEILQRHHRYAVVWPSVNPEAARAIYRWWAPDGGPLNGPPRVAVLPMLPDAWVDRLRDDTPEAETRPPVAPRPVPAGAPAMSAAVQKVLDGHQDWTARHTTARNAAMALARLEHLGYPGTQAAFAEIERRFMAALAGEEHRNPEKEWEGLVVSARARAATTASKIPDYESAVAAGREKRRAEERAMLRGWLGKAVRHV